MEYFLKGKLCTEFQLNYWRGIGQTEMMRRISATCQDRVKGMELFSHVKELKSWKKYMKPQYSENDS